MFSASLPKQTHEIKLYKWHKWDEYVNLMVKPK